MPTPPSRVCPLCAAQDDLDRPRPLPGGGWQFTCRGPHNVYTFEVDPDNVISAYPEGLAADLGLYEDLLTLISDEAVFIEYGVVEYLYGVGRPDNYRKIVSTYGHTALAPRRYTASSFIAGVLGRLFARREVGGDFGVATGYWEYNSIISYW